MCLALPAQVVEIHSPSLATINLGGIQKQVSIELVPEVNIGDYVVVHVGFAIGVIDADEAARTLQLFDQLAAHQADDEVQHA